jgi:dTMP kinase
VRLLGQSLEGSDSPVHFTREPGGTQAAERIREVLLDPAVEMDPWTEAYLYAAARADHVRGEISPRLRRGEDVICERFLDSSVAYQGFGRGLGAAAVRELNARAVGDVTPDRTFYLRLGAGERERRARHSGAPPDRIEGIGAGFMRRVEEGFEELTLREPERIEVLDASRPPEELAGAVLRALQR